MKVGLALKWSAGVAEDHFFLLLTSLRGELQQRQKEDTMS